MVRLPATSLAVLFVGCIALAGCTEAERPRRSDGFLDVGDSWTLRITPHEHGGEPYTMHITETIVARTVRNGTDAYEVRTIFEWPKEFERPGRTFERNETAWLRVGDLARIERVAHTETVLFASEYPDAAGSYRGESKTVYDPPCANVVMAVLDVGATWNATCQGRGASFEYDRDGRADTYPGSEHDVTEYRVEAQETLRVGAGTFEVHRVASTTDDPRTSDDSASALAWVAKGPCPPVPVRTQSQYENAEHGGSSVMELVELSC